MNGGKADAEIEIQMTEDVRKNLNITDNTNYDLVKIHSNNHIHYINDSHHSSNINYYFST